MKTILTIIFACLCSCSNNAHADTKTPIDNDSYAVFERSFYKSCVGSTVGARIQVFCVCGASVSTANLMLAVKTHNLHYDEEIPSIMAEATLSSSQVAVCRNKANQ